MLPLPFFLPPKAWQKEKKFSSTFFLISQSVRGKRGFQLQWHWLHLLRAISLLFLIMFFAYPVAGKHPFRKFLIIVDNRPMGYEKTFKDLLLPFLNALPQEMRGMLWPLCGKPRYGTVGGLKKELPKACSSNFRISPSPEDFKPYEKEKHKLFIFSPDPAFSPFQKKLQAVQAAPQNMMLSVSPQNWPWFFPSHRTVQFKLALQGFAPSGEKVNVSLSLDKNWKKNLSFRSEQIVALPPLQPGKHHLEMTVATSNGKRSRTISFRARSSLPLYFLEGEKKLEPLRYALVQDEAFPFHPVVVSNFKGLGKGIYFAAKPESARQVPASEKSIIFLDSSFPPQKWLEALPGTAYSLKIVRFLTGKERLVLTEPHPLVDFIPQLDISNIFFHGHFQIATDLFVFLRFEKSAQPALTGNHHLLLINFSIFSSSPRLFQSEAFVLFFRELVSRFAMLAAQTTPSPGLHPGAYAALSPSYFLRQFRVLDLRLPFLFLFACGLLAEVFWFRKAR